MVTVDSTSVDLQGLMVRRARREYRVPIQFTDLDQRDGFDETVLNFTPEEAKAEAARCLDCHEICSLCVGVCPNMALLTYEMDPVVAALPALSVSGGKITVEAGQDFRATQGLQIAVLTDFCNECGNCETVCPTSGSPYRDKPRLYLDKADFEAQTDNAFMMHGDSVIESRVNGETHRIEVNGDARYSSPSLTATLNRETLAVIDATPGDTVVDGADVSLEAAAVMLTLLAGLDGSQAHVPVYAQSGTVIAHPGYSEE